MKKRHQRLLLNFVAYSVLAIAIYLVFIQKEKPIVPYNTLNANAASR